MRSTITLLATLAIFAVGGCDVPPHMRIATSTHPKNIDKNVRYRTTYYFRTFDFCAEKNAQDQQAKNKHIIPATDTLYRYRLTGKANALTTKVHFESGVLDAHVIDPFGAKVVYDEDGGFRVQTAEETEARARQRDALEMYDAVFKRLIELKDSKIGNVPNLESELGDALRRALGDYTGIEPDDEQRRVAEFALDQPKVELSRDGDQFTVTTTRQVSKTVTQTASGNLAAEESKTTLEVSPEAEQAPEGLSGSRRPRELQCPDDGEFTIRRGYQIMGPEGIQTFDQDDRLLLAMTINGKPLIGLLNEYSSRILHASASPGDALLPLVQEDLAIAQAQLEVKLRKEDQQPPEVASSFAAVIEAFDRPRSASAGE